MEPKLLDRMRALLRTKHYSIRTEDAYVQWARRFILFHVDFDRHEIVVRRGKGDKDRRYGVSSHARRAAARAHGQGSRAA
jgi:Phage integrase, N-terminal SAM-like domain